MVLEDVRCFSPEESSVKCAIIFHQLFVINVAKCNQSSVLIDINTKY
jgi:hypothetical protein